ncbi:proline dehydrogenase family protein, partial [Microbacterium sp.]|uniref:proline dehydrogenase family protein n=1 Tax=Microbacterium sp. TaxID=51671 RepID=UPI0039E2F423
MSEASPSSPRPLAERAAELAQRWRTDAGAAGSDGGRRFALGIADPLLSPASAAVAAAALHRAAADVPSALPWYVRGAVRAGGGIAPLLPVPTVPIARRLLRDALRPLIVDLREPRLAAELARVAMAVSRRAGAQEAPEGTAGSDRGLLDVRVAGEAVLGEAGARRRLDASRALIRSGAAAQISLAVRQALPPMAPWAFDETVERAAEALLPLYGEGVETGTTICLDATGPGDLDLTIAVFTRILEHPSLLAAEAAMSLPTWSRDALPAARELAAWARERAERGGAPITLRLDHSDDLAGARAASLVHRWQEGVHESAADADAALLRVLDESLAGEGPRAVRVEVCVHDLGLLAYARLRAEECGAALGLDLLHGARPDLAAAIAGDGGAVRFRVAAAAPSSADAALAELSLALVEADRSLSRPGSDRLRAALRRIEEGFSGTRVRPPQDRRAPVHESARPLPAPPPAEDGLTQAVLGITRGSDDGAFFETAVYSEREIEAEVEGAPGFENAPATDPSSAANREWAREIFARIAAGAADAPRAGAGADPAAPPLADVRAAGARWGARPAAA